MKKPARIARAARGPHRVIALFVIVTALPITALAWLGWHLVTQDRELDHQRLRDRLDSRVGLVALALEQQLTEAAERLPDPAASPHTPPDASDDAVVVTFTAGGSVVAPAASLVYYPEQRLPRTDPHDAIFAAGDQLDLQQNDHAGAIAAIRRLTRDADPVVRAQALIRVARNYRKLSRFRDALDTYRELEAIGPVRVLGMPADLIALLDQCKVLRHLGREADASRLAERVAADVTRGRWALDRTTYETYVDEARSLFPPSAQPQEPSPGRLALAAGVEQFWTEWQSVTRPRPGHGWRSTRVPVDAGDASMARSHPDERPVLLLWRATDAGATVLVAGPSYIASHWGHTWTDQDMTATLVDSGGYAVLGQQPPRAAPVATRRLEDTRLPWTISVREAGDAAAATSTDSRQKLQLMLAGFLTMLTVVVLGGYFTARALSREFAAARLQSDFVAAVSHEFRTPLTSLQHLTELLATGVVTTEDRRRQYYEVMARETTRLHRMVEGLLAFGRMEALGRRGEFEAIDPAELARQTVDDFRSASASATHRVELTTDVAPQSLHVRANREALSRAVRNLLENAVKYSPNGQRVEVRLTRDHEHVNIHVLDEGCGIALDEQKTIFETFTRGTAAKELDVPGSGVGLAMTRRIIDAHEGELLLDSAPGRGSTFTIRLPATDATSSVVQPET